MKHHWSQPLGGLALLLAIGSAQAEPATLVRASELRAKPALDATVLATLPEKAQVDLQGNEGGWSKVKTADGKVGYVRLLNVRPNGAGGSSSNGLATLGTAVKSGSTTSVATTGVKGVTKEDIEHATPNPAEVKQMDRYAANEADARQAAKAGKLVAQNVPLLEDRK